MTVKINASQKPAPPEFPSRNRPTKQKDRLQIEDHEEHRDQIKLGGPAHACRSLGNNPRLIRERRWPDPGAAAPSTYETSNIPATSSKTSTKYRRSGHIAI